MEDENKEVQQSDIPNLKKRGIRLPVIIIAATAAVVLIIITTIGVAALNNGERRLVKQLDIAHGQMERMEYEQAKASYQLALVIDPMCVEAYLGLADAYVGLGDYESAIKTLEEGYKMTGDESIKHKLDALNAKVHPSPTPTPLPTPTPSPAPTATPTPAPEPTEEPTPTEEPSPTEKPKATPTSKPAAPAVVKNSSSCTLIDAGTISLTAAFSSAPKSDDGLLHVFQLAPFQYSTDGAKEVANVAVSANPAVSFAMGDAAVGGLYSKYVFAAVQRGQFVMQGEPQYITNPEILATNTRGRVAYPRKSLNDYFTNWEVNVYGEARPIMQIYNEHGGSLKHPYANEPDSHVPDEIKHYMRNAATSQGVNDLAEAMKRVAAIEGTQDYIIGNEVNIRKWCYMAYKGDETYIKEYQLMEL